jgi:hypothetical protein
MLYDAVRGEGEEKERQPGCGGSKQDWDNTDYTEIGSGMIQDHAFHLFLCQDVPLVVGHGSCYLKL